MRDYKTTWIRGCFRNDCPICHSLRPCKTRYRWEGYPIKYLFHRIVRNCILVANYIFKR